MANKTEVIQNLTKLKKKRFLAHFNKIYKCTELTEHEYKIIYLAWLWAFGFIFKDVNGMSTFDEAVAGVPLSDYEISFEDEHSGGVNLDLMHNFYNIGKIIQILCWDSITIS